LIESNQLICFLNVLANHTDVSSRHCCLPVYIIFIHTLLCFLSLSPFTCAPRNSKRGRGSCFVCVGVGGGLEHLLFNLHSSHSHSVTESHYPVPISIGCLGLLIKMQNLNSPKFSPTLINQLKCSCTLIS